MVGGVFLRSWESMTDVFVLGRGVAPQFELCRPLLQGEFS